MYSVQQNQWLFINIIEPYTLVYLYDETGAPLGYRYRTPSYASGVFDGYFFEKNLQGDIVAVYNQNGVKLAGYVYDAWGKVTVTYYNGGSTTAAQYNPFRYRGYYYDTETGWYYLQSRYYDPVMGRFINADGYVSTGQGLLGYNMFAYCGNNPIMYCDCSGDCAHTILGNDCIHCKAGDDYSENLSAENPSSPFPDIDESLYDSHRNNLNPALFRERMLGIVGNHPSFEFNKNGVYLNLLDYSLYFYQAGWYAESWSTSATIGKASIAGYINTSKDKNKKQGFDVGVKASVFSGYVSFNVFGVSIELYGDAITAGAGIEITNKRCGGYVGYGWLGGGIVISWE